MENFSYWQFYEEDPICMCKCSIVCLLLLEERACKMVEFHEILHFPLLLMSTFYVALLNLCKFGGIEMYSL